MRTYETSYGPDTFERIRLGVINELYLCYAGYQRPVEGDLLKVKSVIKQIAVNEIVMRIATLVDCPQMKNTVLLKVEPFENCIFKPSYAAAPGAKVSQVKTTVSHAPIGGAVKTFNAMIENHAALIEAAERKYFADQKKAAEKGED